MLAQGLPLLEARLDAVHRFVFVMLNLTLDQLSQMFLRALHCVPFFECSPDAGVVHAHKGVAEDALGLQLQSLLALFVFLIFLDFFILKLT